MSSAVRQEAISLVEKLYMDDYFVPDRKTKVKKYIKNKNI